MPPKGMFFSARPPIHRSMSLTPVSAAGPLRKARRSASPITPPPNTMSLAAARLASRVVAPVMLAWVP
ncbi:hypothetical protein D3C78_619600 [compost metagenome]